MTYEFHDWYDWDEAVEAIADAMLRFDGHVSNEQGACDTGTMNSMLSAAKSRYEELAE